MKSLSDVLRDIVEVCQQHQLDYAVMGGLAVRVHGIPRPTYDVDITVAATGPELNLLLNGLESRGYTVPEPYRQGWVDRVAEMPVVKVRCQLESGFGIDVDLFLAESEFQQRLLSRAQTAESESGPIKIVSPEDLILLKLIANRPRDLGDIQDILFVQGSLDQTYLQTWAKRLNISDRLHSVLADHS
jgi:hypothetical protein